MIDNPYYSQEAHGPYELMNIGSLELEEGGSLANCTLAVATHGKLNAAALRLASAAHHARVAMPRL